MKFEPCYRSSQCWDEDPRIVGCWICLWCQLVIGLILLGYRRCSFLGVNTSTTPKSNVSDEFTDNPNPKYEEDADTLKRLAFCNNKDVREMDNFVKDNTDESILYPNPYSAEYVPLDMNSTTNFFFGILRVRRIAEDVKVVVLDSLGYSLISSSVGTILSLRLAFDEVQGNTGLSDFIGMFEVGMKEVIQSYKFLPIFLMVAYITFIVDRWRTFMTTCHEIQGAIHNIGILCGGSVHVPVKRSTREKLHKIYRYLNVVHAMCLQSLSPTLKDHSIGIGFQEKLNLLTKEEARLIRSMDNKMRDGTLALLTSALMELNNSDNITTRPIGDPSMQEILKSVGVLRGKTSKLHDLFVRDNPNQYLVAMQFFVGNYCLLIMMGYPFILLYENLSIVCLQPLTIIGTYFSFISMQIPFALMNSIRNPFRHDTRHCIEVDNLLASTERSLFQSMRSLFHSTSEQKINFRRASTNRSTMMRKITMLNSFKGKYGEL